MQFTKWNVIGGIWFFVMGGPIGLILFALCYFAFILYMSRRGLLFIQSYLYLITLWDTQDVIQANWIANDLSPNDSFHYLDGALEFAKRYSGGMQLPVIQEARQNGFKYNPPSFVSFIRYINAK